MGVLTKTGPLLLLITGLLACKGSAPSTPQRSSRNVATASVTTGSLDFGDIGGLSGLTSGEASGQFYAVPERDRVLFTLSRSGSNLSITSTRAIRGVPAGLDTEAITRLDDGSFAIGTESTAERTGDVVLVARVTGSELQVQHKLQLPYEIFGFVPEENRGIEGICSAGGHLIAAIETPIEVANERFVPIARRASGASQWTAFRAPLSSATGKAAGLDCRMRGADIEVTMIERHYEVSRVLRFTVPATGPGRTLTSTVVGDLDSAFTKNPNFEGLALTPRGFLLLSDNQSARIYDDTYTAFVER